MTNKHKPEAFPLRHIGPDPDLLKPGGGVFVKWSNGITYKGIVKRKLRKNYEIEINDDQWIYPHNLASVPSYALIPNRYIGEEEKILNKNRWQNQLTV